MDENVPQNFENHGRWDPPYHVVAFGILIINLVWALYAAVSRHSVGDIIYALVAFALMIMFFKIRIYSLSVQDRLIRLEMKIRFRDLGLADMDKRFGEFTMGQLVGLRFAGDDELGALARKALDEKITDRKLIKQAVKNWKADNCRV